MRSDAIGIGEMNMVATVDPGHGEVRDSCLARPDQILRERPTL